MMENGRRSYAFVSPLMEGYSMATNPYQEFRRGIKMTTYTQDSTNLVDATITANYAIYYENQRLWEAKGNVIIIKNNRKDGDTTVTSQTEIYTQQLFWNATTKKIYSNVDTKILQADGWHFGVGFDADEDLKNIHFRKYSSEVEFDMSQPTEEELEEQNKKHVEQETKKNANNKNSSNKRDVAKPFTDKKFDPSPGNRPSSANTVRPSTSPSNKNTMPNNNRPTTAPATGRKEQLSAEGMRTTQSPTNKPGNKIQHAELSTSTDLNLETKKADLNNLKLEHSVKQ
jgi:LPS export ABC transporter protein LptC